MEATCILSSNLSTSKQLPEYLRLDVSRVLFWLNEILSVVEVGDTLIFLFDLFCWFKFDGWVLLIDEDGNWLYLNGVFKFLESFEVKGCFVSIGDVDDDFASVGDVDGCFISVDDVDDCFVSVGDVDGCFINIDVADDCLVSVDDVDLFDLSFSRLNEPACGI